jgi:hypothetical protein
LIQDNVVQNFSGDGMRPNASNVLVKDNKILDSYLSINEGDTNHDDAIQFFAIVSNTVIKTFDNIEVVGTFIEESTSPSRRWIGPLQGISVFDGQLTHWHVHNNAVLVSAYHGIAGYGIKDSLIENNTVANPTTNGRPTWIMAPISSDPLVGAPNHTVIRNNTAVTFYRPVVGVSYSNNITVVDPKLAYKAFDITTDTYDLRPKAGGIIDGLGVGAFPTGPVVFAPGDNLLAAVSVAFDSLLQYFESIFSYLGSVFR